MENRNAEVTGLNAEAIGLKQALKEKDDQLKISEQSNTKVEPKQADNLDLTAAFQIMYEKFHEETKQLGATNNLEVRLGALDQDVRLLHTAVQCVLRCINGSQGNTSSGEMGEASEEIGSSGDVSKFSNDAKHL